MFALLALLATLSLGLGDNGKSFTLPPRTAVVVTLPTNGSTGYDWRMKGPLDKSVIRLVSHRYIPPKKHVPGAGGEQVWRFATVGAGSFKLRFVYIRSFEKNKPPARRFGVTINVS